MPNNPGVAFLRCDVANTNSRSIAGLFGSKKRRVLAGCALGTTHTRSSRGKANSLRNHGGPKDMGDPSLIEL